MGSLKAEGLGRDHLADVVEHGHVLVVVKLEPLADHSARHEVAGVWQDAGAKVPVQMRGPDTVRTSGWWWWCNGKRTRGLTSRWHCAQTEAAFAKDPQARTAS